LWKYQTSEVIMAKRAGMYKREKRKKELVRKKKQEEKRLKRQKNPNDPSEEAEATVAINTEPDAQESPPG
jgi:hypothetical protein